MKKVIYIIALLLGAMTMAQTITVNGTPMLVSDDISFPFWLESGSSISPEVPVSSISVLEFNIVPNNNGNDMVFNQVISVTEGQTVPEGKTWKVESILMENQEFVLDSSNTSLDSAFVASMIAEALSSGSQNINYQPNIFLECVDMGVSVMCGGFGLSGSASLSIDPQSMSYPISVSSNSENGVYENPQWRKFQIHNLNINANEQIMFRNNREGGNPSSPITGNITLITPEVDDDGNVYFYLYAYCSGNCCDDECNSQSNLLMTIPESHSITSRYTGYYCSYNSGFTWNNWEIFYSEDGSWKNTGIYFNTN